MKKDKPRPEVRMLNPSEIESLRDDAVTSAAYFKMEFSKMPRLLTPEELAACWSSDDKDAQK